MKKIISTFVFTGLFCTVIQAQNNDSNSFQFEGELNNKLVRISCQENCSQGTIQSRLKRNGVIRVTDSGYGFNKNRGIYIYGSSNAFVFEVRKVNDVLYFKGIKGTAWKNLSFQCPTSDCNFVLNNSGVEEI